MVPKERADDGCVDYSASMAHHEFFRPESLYGRLNKLTIIAVLNMYAILPVVIGIFVYMAPAYVSVAIGIAFVALIATSDKYKHPYADSKFYRNWGARFDFFKYLNFHVRPEDETTKEVFKKRATETQFVFGMHPHGVFPMQTSYFQFPVSKEWNDIVTSRVAIATHTLVADVLFMIPFARWHFGWTGCVSANRKTMQEVIDTKHNVAIVVGGEKEVLIASQKRHACILKDRKGFVRMALQNGMDLVPTYTFGNEKHFKFYNFFPKFFAWVQETLKMSIVFYTGYKGLGIPFLGTPFTSFPTTTVIGTPIPCPPGDILTADGKVDAAVLDAHHATYVKALRTLFDAHKVACGYDESLTLEII